MFLFTLSCRKCVWIKLFVIHPELFPHAKQPIFLDTKIKLNVHICCIIKGLCLFINAGASHNALGYPHSMWPPLSLCLCNDVLFTIHLSLHVMNNLSCWHLICCNRKKNNEISQLFLIPCPSHPVSFFPSYSRVSKIPVGRSFRM